MCSEDKSNSDENDQLVEKAKEIIRTCVRIELLSFPELLRTTLCVGVNGAEVKGRQVAVDWLVPKAQYEASLQKAEETDDDRQEEDDDGLGESDSEMDGEEEGGMEGELESSNASGREEEEEEEEEGEGEKSFKSDVHEGKTVFVR